MNDRSKRGSYWHGFIGLGSTYKVIGLGDYSKGTEKLQFEGDSLMKLRKCRYTKEFY